MHEGSRDEGADDDAVGAEVPGHHEGSLDEPLDRRALIAVAVLVIVGTVVMATRHGGGQSRAAEPTARPRPDGQRGMAGLGRLPGRPGGHRS